jgi:membrane-associated phospholipid phosphatase
MFAFFAVSTSQGQNDGSMSQQQAGSAAGASTAASPLREIDPVYDKYTLQPGEDPENRLLSPFLKHIAMDQKQFWTAPTHFTVKDLKWGVPFVGFTAGLIAGDSWISKQIPNKPGQLKTSLNVSNYSTYAFIGLGAGSFLLGKVSRNDHLSETGLLSGEAAINATGITYLLKEITQRPRPNVGNGNGAFFTGGNSFTSEHSAAAWAIASIWAHEYPSTLSQILAYGLASTVTITRVTAQQHFSSDVFVGSALGWYLGRQVYRAHHDPELGGTAWGSLLPDDTGDKPRNPANMGSPYVPLDGWVYPLLERLAALGYIKTAYLGIRPWTRMECARMLEEAGERLTDENVNEKGEAGKMYAALQTEFAPETGRLDGAQNLGASLDSVYTRVTNISGKPLRDGYHFGQTIINDYGRPYGEGFNNITGFTSHAVAGPLSVSVQGEYQHAPAIGSDPANVQQAIAAADFTTPVSNARAEVNRFDLLDGTVAATFGNTQFSFGKQSQWWGPGESGSLLFSNSAEPIVMFKIDSVSPYRVPLLSKLLGPIRTEYFLGRLAGHQFEANGDQLLGPGNINPQPFLHGAKISFKPTSNLEIGMGFTAQFVGPGLPFTWRDYLRTFYVHSQTGPTTAANNPAKRITSADFSYRVPGLRDWFTFYLDAMAVDEISPIGSTRATVNPGIYLPKFPKLNQLELRAEGINEPLTAEFAPGFVYFGDRRYRSGYTNDGNLLGNAIGRAGRGGQGWMTYRFSPRSSLQFGYRLQEVSKDFLGGGRLADYSAAGNVMLSRNVSLKGYLQYEEWGFRLLSATVQSNFTASVQLTFYPKTLRLHH